MASEIKLHNGKVLYANQGIIGIDENLELYHGYDGSFPEYFDASDGVLIKAEQIEVANIAIQRWKEFRRKAKE